MSAARANPDKSVGTRFIWLAAIGSLVLLTMLFSGLTERGGGIVESGIDGQNATVVLERDPSGHYLADGQINGRSVRFLVDTGATDVAIPEPVAREMGLEFGPRITVMTAAGPSMGWMTRLDSVSVGALRLTNIRATITSGPMQEVLLGMSFLKHLSLSQQGDRLILQAPSEAP